MQNKPNLMDAQMNLTTYYNMAYAKMRDRDPRKNKPNFNPSINDRSFPLFTFLSPPPNHQPDYKNAKQTQFPKHQNERKPRYINELSRLEPPRRSDKQTQFQPKNHAAFERGIWFQYNPCSFGPCGGVLTVRRASGAAV